MDFESYKKKISPYDMYPEKIPEWLQLPAVYCIGVANEGGEVTGVIKKAIRDKWTPIRFREEVKKELGDVMWYTARLLNSLGMTIEEVLDANVAKLDERHRKGTLTGDRFD